MDRRFLMWARDTLAVYRKCLAMSHGVKSSEEKTWMPMMSPSSGLTVILNALHMCKHVSVFGIAEDPIQPGKTPYQVTPLFVLALPSVLAFASSVRVM
jgi:hypothetical protein